MQYIYVEELGASKQVIKLRCDGTNIHNGINLYLFSDGSTQIAAGFPETRQSCSEQLRCMAWVYNFIHPSF